MPGMLSKNALDIKKRLADCLMFERKLVALREQVKLHNIPVYEFEIPVNEDPYSNNKSSVSLISTNSLQQPMLSSSSSSPASAPLSPFDTLAELKEWLTPIEQEVVLNTTYENEVEKNLLQLREYYHVVAQTALFDLSQATTQLEEEMSRQNQNTFSKTSASMNLDKRAQHIELLSSSSSSSSPAEVDKFQNFITGVIENEMLPSFHRLLFRATRGNVWLRFHTIDVTNNYSSTSATSAASSSSSSSSPAPATADSSLSSTTTSFTVFHIVYIGQVMETKIRKLCDHLKARIYKAPANAAQYADEMRRLKQELHDQQDVMNRTHSQTVRVLQRVAGDKTVCPIRDWERALKHEQALLHALMHAHFHQTMLTIEGWVPATDLTELKRVTVQAVEGTSYPAAHIEDMDIRNLPSHSRYVPPTFFRTNKFTSVFQVIVDTYGTPRYKEVNPGLFTVITFPFLFGVMYGDIGHGTLLSIFALLFILFEDGIILKIRRKEFNEIGAMAFGGRYLILPMGLFAIYCGVIYNDCFSIPVSVYQSSFVLSTTTTANITTRSFVLREPGHVYPVGIDPQWAVSGNGLTFYNSFKMKLAVILGVIQMLFGVMLSVFNHVYFKDWPAIIFEFIPRMIFLLCTFGYMDFMIIYKWCLDWSNNSGDAPSLIQTMIHMFLNPGSIDHALYESQAVVQVILLLAALFSVPVMLFGKPCYKHKCSSNRRHHLQEDQDQDDPQQPQRLPQPSPSPAPPVITQTHGKENLLATTSDDDKGAISDSASKEESRSASSSTSSSSSSDEVSGGTKQQHVVDLTEIDLASPSAPTGGSSGAVAEGETGEAHSFSDDMIHQGIHTIEFVLGAVSNTASYLRLWALSLAHAQLAEVFWTKMMGQYGYENSSPIFAFVGFAVWAAATFAVLLCMDVLECFLHALRLHWVEFQNKFFYADGIPFVPFKLDSDDE